MKKLFAVFLAALTFVTVFSFTACSPSTDEAGNAADEIIEKLESFGYAATSSEGTLKVTNKTSEEKVLTQSGERLSFSESTAASETLSREAVNFADGESDAEEIITSGGGTLYNYSFIRGGQSFTYSGKKQVENFSGIVLKIDEEDPEVDSPELLKTVNSVILSVAKATKALSLEDGKLKVNLNAVVYGIVSDLNYIFDNAGGKITVGAVFADEKIKGYFSNEIYEKITEALSSNEAYQTAAEIIYMFSGGLISLPEADTLAEVDITEAAKDFKKLTEKVTGTEFVIAKTEKDIETSEASAVITEQSVSVYFSDAEMVYTVNGGVISEQSVSINLNLDMADKEDRAFSYASDRNYANTKTKLLTYAISETIKYSTEKCKLTDIGKAVAEYREYVIEDGAHSSYIRHNDVSLDLYSKLSESGFNFVIKAYVDKNDSVTDVAAEAYSFYAPIKSVYNKAERSLTLSGGKLSAPLTVYLNFDKHADKGGSMFLGVELYSTAADRDKRRLCDLRGEYQTGFSFEDGSSNYYPVNIYYNSIGSDINEAEATTVNEKITALNLTGYGYKLDCIYAAANDKITVTINKSYSAPETVNYYTGVAADNGYDVRIGLYVNYYDAKAGSDRYEFYFEINRTLVTKTVTVEEYLQRS